MKKKLLETAQIWRWQTAVGERVGLKLGVESLTSLVLYQSVKGLRLN